MDPHCLKYNGPSFFEIQWNKCKEQETFFDKEMFKGNKLKQKIK